VGLIGEKNQRSKISCQGPFKQKVASFLPDLSTKPSNNVTKNTEIGKNVIKQKGVSFLPDLPNKPSNNGCLLLWAHASQTDQ
jgi:hypothetical protein